MIGGDKEESVIAGRGWKDAGRGGVKRRAEGRRDERILRERETEGQRDRGA